MDSLQVKVIALESIDDDETEVRGMVRPDETDNSIRFAAIFKLAVQTFGGEEKANDWLNSPNRALGGKTPVEVATNSGGNSDVEKLLGRIAHGVIS